MTTIDTHLEIDQALCGRPARLAEGRADVLLDTTAVMAADARGLVHGGFVFGAADYAAMLAVNHPHVVLGAAEVRFVAPVRVGQRVRLRAEITGEKGKKRVVAVRGAIAPRTEDHDGADGPDGPAVFEGTFTCFVLDAHVLGDP